MAEFKLQIPKPCTERWEKMNATKSGAYCNSCQKEVIDFTRMTEQEVKDFFLQANGAVCGRFQKRQLEHSYKLTEYKTSTWEKWIMATIIGLGLPGIAVAQLRPPAKPDTVQSEPVREDLPTRQTLSKPDSNGHLPLPVYYGPVVDKSTGEPLPGTAVRMLNSSFYTVTDMDGHFQVKQDSIVGDASAVYEISFVGFKTLTFTLAELQKKPVIALEPDIIVLGEMIVAGGVHVSRWWSPRRLWWRIKNIF